MTHSSCSSSCCNQRGGSLRRLPPSLPSPPLRQQLEVAPCPAHRRILPLTLLLPRHPWRRPLLVEPPPTASAAPPPRRQPSPRPLRRKAAAVAALTAAGPAAGLGGVRTRGRFLPVRPPYQRFPPFAGGLRRRQEAGRPQPQGLAPPLAAAPSGPLAAAAACRGRPPSQLLPLPRSLQLRLASVSTLILPRQMTLLRLRSRHPPLPRDRGRPRRREGLLEVASLRPLLLQRRLLVGGRPVRVFRSSSSSSPLHLVASG